MRLLLVTLKIKTCGTEKNQRDINSDTYRSQAGMERAGRDVANCSVSKLKRTLPPIVANVGMQAKGDGVQSGYSRIVRTTKSRILFDIG